MMRLFICMAVTCGLMGCTMKEKGSSPVLSAKESLEGQARLAYLVLSLDGEVPDDSQEDSVTPTECPCGGSKRSGDGLGPCICVANGGNCQCARTSAALDDPQVAPSSALGPPDDPIDEPYPDLLQPVGPDLQVEPPPENTPSTTGPVVRLQFWSAKWCTLCPPAKETAQAAADLLGVPLETFDWDVDANQRGKCRIKSVPTLTVSLDNKTTRWLTGKHVVGHIVQVVNDEVEKAKNPPLQSQATADRIEDWASVAETWPARVPINGTTRYSKSIVLWHLRGGGSGGSNHSGKAYHSWPLDSMTVGQLATLHDRDHEYTTSTSQSR